MSRNVILLAAVIILNWYGATYAAGPIRGGQSASASPAVPKDLDLSQPGQFSRPAAPVPGPAFHRAAETQSLPPTASERRSEVQKTMEQLIAFSRKASSDIRRELKKMKMPKDRRINDAGIKESLALADKFDQYALFLEQKERVLTDNDRDIDETLQTMTDMSQQLQLQLQDAMNKQQQAMQMLSNIMKNQHDTLKSIINNMK